MSVLKRPAGVTTARFSLAPSATAPRAVRAAALTREGAAPDTELTASLHRIAERFRRAREEAGLTLRQVAERASIAPSTVQKIENCKIVPSIAVAVRLANALNRRPSYFIEGDHEAETDVRFIARGRGRRLGTRPDPVAVQQIAEPLVNPRMEAYLLTVQPGGESGSGELLIHRGEEIVVCTKGRVRFDLRGQDYTLSPGDTLHFKGDIPHRWENPGPREAAMLIICAFTNR